MLVLEFLKYGYEKERIGLKEKYYGYSTHVKPCGQLDLVHNIVLSDENNAEGPSPAFWREAMGTSKQKSRWVGWKTTF